MDTLSADELKLFVKAVRQYFVVLARQEPQVTSAYLATGELRGHEYNGVVSFSGAYEGNVIVSMPGPLLRELLVLQGEKDLSSANLLDAVGEIANTLGGNARKSLGPTLKISVPARLQGHSGVQARVRKHPYAITLKWNQQPAVVWVDMARR